MKKEVRVAGKNVAFINTRAIVIGAFALLANVALAGNTTTGALIKVNHQLNGEAFSKLSIDVKSVNGNILSVQVSNAAFSGLIGVEGICAVEKDHKNSALASLNFDQLKSKYAGAGVVIGILDNKGTLGSNDLQSFKKIEKDDNVGFISYRSDDPNSTVIMRNLKGGESNLLQALSYMEEYAKTVGKALVIEMLLDGAEMGNPLFVQACQQKAENGIQFIGSDIDLTGMRGARVSFQLAFSMYNVQTGQVTDHSDFWMPSEMEGQQIQLLGSDNSICSFKFISENGMQKIFVHSTSEDIVMAKMLDTDGNMHYFNIEGKETAVVPRKLFSGVPVLEDGMAGVYPFLSKKALFKGESTDKQVVALCSNKQSLVVSAPSQMDLTVASSKAGILDMQLKNVDESLIIEIKDKNGAVVYLNHPGQDVASLQAKIDLSKGTNDLYFLSLSSPISKQTFPILMN